MGRGVVSTVSRLPESSVGHSLPSTLCGFWFDLTGEDAHERHRLGELTSESKQRQLLYSLFLLRLEADVASSGGSCLAAESVVDYHHMNWQLAHSTAHTRSLAESGRSNAIWEQSLSTGWLL